MSMSYEKYYQSGWLEGETGNTPITPSALNYMETGITNAHVAADAAQSTANTAKNTANTAQNTANTAKNTADAALPKAGGTLTGILMLTEGVHYGSTLPSAGNKGRIFLKKV